MAGSNPIPDGICTHARYNKFHTHEWNHARPYGKDGDIEYFPNVLEYPRILLGKYS